MRHLRIPLLAFAVIAAPASAVAADMPWGRGPAVISERGPVEEEIGTGWYLRGDIGFSRATAPSVTMGAATFNDAGHNSAPVYGGGFGYRFTDWLRADLTVDQIASYGLKHRLGTVGCFIVDACTVDRRFDGTVVPVLANAYLDLGNWAGFTPYVGGGVGAARLRASGSFTYTDLSTAATLTTRSSVDAKWSPAFAAMAGLAVDLGAGIKLDAGYRYLWLSEGTSGTMSQIGNAGLVPTTVELKNSGFHQARVGLRYSLN